MIHQIKNKTASVTAGTYLLLACTGILYCAPVHLHKSGVDSNGTAPPGQSGNLKKTAFAPDRADRPLPQSKTGAGLSDSGTANTAANTPDGDRLDSAGSPDSLTEKTDTLYDDAVSDLESLVWDSTKINFARLDSGAWTDTIRIVLADSAKGKCYCHPIGGPITSNFGQRNWRWHYGTDVRLMTGDTVRCALDGIVRLVAYDRHGYGHVIVVRHADGLETLYGHLSKTIAVSNQPVKAGEVLGLGGNTGHSTGPHLHFETRYYGHAFDPCHIVDFDSCRLRQDTLVLTKADFEYLVELRKEKWVAICKGNTLGSIARRYHTSIAKLCSLNHITRKTILSIGRKIRYQ